MTTTDKAFATDASLYIPM